jgi:hypothetical protein
VQSLLETSRQTPSYVPEHGASSRPFSGGVRRGLGCGAIDSASYQAMLANLGLEPDPRLCVPAARS